MYENIKLYIACTSLNVHFGAKRKGEREVAWCTANETFYLDNKTTSPYTVHCTIRITYARTLKKELSIRCTII